MASKTLIFAASAFVGAAMVAAQAAPNWIYIPSACSTQCAQTVESAYLCQTQYPGDTTSVYGCFCNDYPTDATTCASCLNDNNAAALASLLTSTQTACPQALQSCFFECSFDTCASTDVSCQCDSAYLQNIYNCGSCNTANGNSPATQLADFQALQDSCKNQNYTGADQEFTTSALPTINTDGYVAPELTATGGGEAATGDSAATTGGLAAGGSAAATAAATAAVTNAVAASGAAVASGAAAASKATGTVAATKAASAAVSGTAAVAAAVSSKAAASSLSAPAVGGVLAFVGALAALL